MSALGPGTAYCVGENARRRHEAILAFAADSPAAESARAVSAAMQRAVDAFDPPAGEPWYVVYNRRLTAARAYLSGLGMTPERNDVRQMVPEWRLTGWRGVFSNEDLVALAVSRGFAG